MFEWRKARRRARRGQIEFLESVYRLPPAERNFGVCRDRFDRVVATAPASIRCAHLLRAREGKSTILSPALFKVWPSWTWGLQGTGDCVSWGTGHMLDVNLAVAALAGKIRKPAALVSSESIYGFGKSELFNSYGYHGARMNGIDAVEACKQFGTLYRLKYPDYDLTEYEGRYAIAWGESPRSTHGVPDELEPFAAEHKAREYVQVDSTEAGAALLEAGYSWQYCGLTYWPTARTNDGMGKSFTSGWHCMTATGVIYDDAGRPAWWRIANTGHGDHVDGPNEPGAVPTVYQECGGWVPNRLVEPVIRDGDCYCVTWVEGWPVLDLPDLGWARWL
jgi:hypothetical protein